MTRARGQQRDAVGLQELYKKYDAVYNLEDEKHKEKGVITQK